MIQVQYRARHAQVLEDLLNAQRGNSRELARSCQQILWEGNRADRLRGVDRTGKRLVPWRWRLKKYKGARGPTLAPFGEASRAISGFFADARKAAGGWTVTAGFRGPGVEILGYHAEGKSGKGKLLHDKKTGEPYFVGVKGRTTGIVRDVFGVSPATYRDLRDEFRRMAGDTFARRAYRAARGVASRAASFLGSFLP